MTIQSQRSRLTVRRPRIRDVVSTIPLLLIGLKVAGVIHLSWWWVLAPIWVPLIPPVLIGVGLLSLYLAYLATPWLAAWHSARARRWNQRRRRRLAP